MKLPALPDGVAPSALRVALRRAAHQQVDRQPDGSLVFPDPLALKLLGDAYAAALRRTPVRVDRPWSTALRAFAVARSRYAEECLAAAAARGVRHYVLLGSGLDTFAWRNCFADLQVWEVDQPAMHGWKQALASRAGLAQPSRCTLVAADLTELDLNGRLALAGLPAAEPACFALLGVAPYLSRQAFRRLLQLVHAHGAGSALVFDYRLHRAALGEEEQKQHDSLIARLAAAGEPFLSEWEPSEMRKELARFGCSEDLDAAAINQRYFQPIQGLAVRGAAVRLVSAVV